MATVTKTSGGKNVPRLRFPEFTGEWEEKSLGDIAEITSSKRVFLSDYVPDGIPFFRGKEISELKRSRVASDVLFIKPSKFFEFKKKFGAPQSGDILITSVGTLGNIFRVNLEYDFYFKDGNLIWMKNPIVNSIFLELNLDFHRRDLLKGVIGSTQKALTIIGIKSVQIPFPTLPEQQKIADFLSTVDDWIENLKREKEQLEKYKKGMMQQIFSQEIRFKADDGNDFPEWEEKKLGEVAKIYDGTHQTPKYVKEGVPFYSVEHLTANNFSQSKYISEEVFENENKRVRLEKGDILMTRIGDIGTARLIDWDIRASFYVSLALIKSNSEVMSRFLTHYIHSMNFQRELWKRAIHVAFPKKINLGEISHCKVKLPSLPEQQKIANFLSSIDTFIEDRAKQIKKAEKWKKGLMQQLFV
ncbi:MAG: restriction endonuclease subunit S [Candidatus Altimarinota bacterium]